jgi:hypothetical protein
MAQAVDRLLCKWEALRSNPIPPTKKNQSLRFDEITLGWYLACTEVSLL